ncbi:MAG: hypothetical protein QM765_13380 [Myxococcales bacterium]
MDYPKGFVVALASEDRVIFDGTRPAGAFSVGRELEVRRMPKAVSAPADRFDVSCGSHLCDARLEIETGAWRLVLSEASSTDLGKSEAELEAGLRDWAKVVLPTLKAAQ